MEGVNEELIFYMVEPGEEYFLHMSLWQHVPLSFKMDRNTEYMDITIIKQREQIVSSRCINDVNYDYIGK